MNPNSPLPSRAWILHFEVPEQTAGLSAQKLGPFSAVHHVSFGPKRSWKQLQNQDSVFKDVTEKPREGPQKERGQEDNFKVGDIVLQKKNVRQEQRKGGKLQADMLGPLKIIMLEGESADFVSGKEK